MTNHETNEDRLKGLTNASPEAGGPLPWETNTPVPPPATQIAASHVAAAPVFTTSAPITDATVSPTRSGSGFTGFPTAVRLAFRNYANFQGRASRSMYWWWWPFVWGAVFVGVIVDGVIQIDNPQPTPIVTVVVLLGLFLPGLSLAIRRLHDMNMRGWWWLLNFAPFGGLALLIIFCQRGTTGDNRFGPDPLS